MVDWIDPHPVKIADDLRAVVGGHPLIAERLAKQLGRNVETALAFLNPDLYTPASPHELPDIDRALERLESAIQNGEPICVWGDFDVDGQTATSLLVEALRDLGANISYRIPLRDEGHGINLEALQAVIDNGARLILTCDTGVAAHEAVDFAQAHGVDVVVTDHHNLMPTLPDAYAVINPKRLPEHHPLRELPGVGVAYKLVEALYTRAGRGAETTRFLDLVALGIVADVALQVQDTRYLLQRGLAVLRETSRSGLREMMTLAELDPARITEEHIGFTLGPRLNALGRLDDANAAVELLTTHDIERARVLAGVLETLNAQRKMLSNQVFQSAISQLEREPELLDLPVLVLANVHWPPGVIGIVASRLAEQYNRPTILIATPPGEPGRGSARSVSTCDITAALAANEHLLLSYGGHTMAAGLRIDPERIPDFRRAFARTVRVMKCVGEEGAALVIDSIVELGDLSLELVYQLERLAPFGAGNPAPILAARGLTAVNTRPVGRTGDHLQVTVQDQGGTQRRVIWWQNMGQTPPPGRFDLAFSLRATDYKGSREIQMEWIAARPTPGDPVYERGLRFQVIDCRQTADPHALLTQLRSEHPNLQVWAEADAKRELDGQPRTDLSPTSHLLIWSIPPGSAELRAALDRAQPQTVYLVGAHAGEDGFDAFIRRLAGLAKFALKSHSGQVSITALAGATNQREAAVRAGLQWLHARGHFAILERANSEWRLSNGTGQILPSLSLDAAECEMILRETAAYRAHFRRAAWESLFSGS